MLAGFLDEPCEPSPYAPASRLAWNEFYIDVTSIPGMSDCAAARELTSASAFRSAITELRNSDEVDYRRIMVLKRQVLEALADAFYQQQPPQLYGNYEHFLEQHPNVEGYAEFRAAHERFRAPWQRWPRGQRDGCLSDADYDQRDKRYHLYAQWIATSQLETLADTAGGGLYLDLPLGVRPDGYDVYRWREVYAGGASAGSPPDAMWTKGQDWCFPPLHPQKIREQGYRHLRDYLSHHLRLSRLLRIDHVMQLHRLYWIPHGMRVDQGAYVRYHAEEFHAVLNLESHRWQTMLIGENLGTVPPEVNRAMDCRGLSRMYVMQYEVASSGEQSGSSVDRDAEQSERVGESRVSAATEVARCNDIPAGSFASLNTHDMPTFAAWWRGTDIAFRRQIDLLSEEGAECERKNLRATKMKLMNWLRTEGRLDAREEDDLQVLSAMLEFLAASDAKALLVNLEDLWLETRPQNVPGTGPELPNWKRKAAMALEEFTKRADMLAVLRRVARVREQAAASATTRVQHTS
jgi:4-alpha-glucanotransferase